MKLGGIELSNQLGAYEIVNIPATSLPQDAATAIGAANTNLFGATFDPIWYVGKQLVNGWNYLFIAKEVRSTKDQQTKIVGLVVNVPAGEGSLNGDGAKIVQIIEEAELPAEVEVAFQIATKQLMGVSYKPIIYVGSQVVRGINYYIVCEAKTIYPGAQPYAVMLTINVFEKQVSVVEVTKIG